MVTEIRLLNAFWYSGWDPRIEKKMLGIKTNNLKILSSY